MLNLRTALTLATLGLSLGTLGTLGTLISCTVHNANHCALNEGACGSGMACSMCAIDNNGCVPAASAIEGQCMFLSGEASDSQVTGPLTMGTQPTMGDTTDGSATSETTVVPTTPTDPSTSSSTTEVDPTVDPTTEGPVCSGPVINVQCAGDTPYCINNDCVSCEDLECSKVDPLKPVCNANLGLCVGCNTHGDCKSDKPACNPDTAICEPCSSHEQCEETACNLEIGQCFPTESVFYVENTAGACSDFDPNFGTSALKPMCSLQTAMARLIEDQPTTIKLTSGTKPQTKSSVVPPGAYTVAVVRYGGQTPSMVLAGADPAIAVSAGNTVFMYNFAIYNLMNKPLSEPLIDCEGATLWIDDQSILIGRTAIYAKNCRVHVRRSQISGHTVGAIEVFGTDPKLAKLWLENTYVTYNGGTKFGALSLGGMASVDILYSTIALNNSPVPPIDCANAWKGEITIRNSAIVNFGEHFGAGCNKVTPITSFESPNGEENQLGSVFGDFGVGVFLAKPKGDLANKAVWRDGDPKLDNDMTLRPTMDGAPDYAGADRP